MQDLDRAAVLRTLHEALPDLARAFGVRSLRLFGSFARGDAGPGSDVDLIVEFDRPVGLLTLAGLRGSLAARLGRSVDVGTVGSLRPRVRESALAESVLVA